MKTPARDNTRLVISATLACLAAGPVAASDWKFSAGVSGKETYTDNVALSPKGSAKSDFITEITPTIGAAKEGARLKVDATYSNQNLFYADDSNRNTTNHQLNAKANVEIIDNEVFLDATASISQSAISPLNASGADNTNSTGNLTSVTAMTVSPYWLHRFGTTATLNARYLISQVGNGDSGLSSSTNSSTTVSLVSGPDFARVTWGLNFSDQTVNYSNRSDDSFTSTSGSLGYFVTPRIRVTGTVGVDENSYATSSSAKTGGTFWNTSIAWTPTALTSLNFGFGHRYYGNSWNMTFRTAGVNSVWTADYSESVNTSNGDASFTGKKYEGDGFLGTTANVGFLPYDVYLSNGQLVRAGTLIPIGIAVYSGRKIVDDPTRLLSDSVFLSKRFSTTFNWKKGRTGFNVSAYRSTQQALQNLQFSSTQGTTPVIPVDSLIKQAGLSAAWTWDLTSLISSKVSANFSRSSYPSLSREDKSSILQFELNRKFSPKLTGNVTLRRQTQDSTQNTSDYTENSLSASLGYKF